jgi:hypothetical protein
MTPEGKERGAQSFTKGIVRTPGMAVALLLYLSICRKKCNDCHNQRPRKGLSRDAAYNAHLIVVDSIAQHGRQGQQEDGRETWGEDFT